MDNQLATTSTPARFRRSALDRKLAAYFAASTAGTLAASQAKAVIVSNSTVQPFGINGAVPIDFNSDGQVDFEIDHDHVDLGGGNFVDFLQIDKNDVNGASPGEDPLAFPTTYFETFPLNGTEPNDTFDAAYVVPVQQGDYPAALLAGTEIGPLSLFDFQEGDDAFGTGQAIRANRLIDEDDGQVDMVLGGLSDSEIYHATNGPNFLGLGGQVRYLGVKMDFENAGGSDTSAVNYGWIGVRITNEADATGEVVGWGYETEVGVSILAGEEGEGLDGDFNGDGKVDAADYVLWRKDPTSFGGDPAGYNMWRAHFGAMSGAGSLVPTDAAVQAVPEPTSFWLALATGLAVICAFVGRRFGGLRRLGVRA
jgi:hypothetical protein